MNGKLVYQWRDWLLRYNSENKYELIHINSNSIRIITARDDLDAENKGRSIIENMRAGQGNPAKQN